MGLHPFSIVDVFAEAKYAGNELAVVRQAASISGPDMQKIAREMNFSETTFILKNEASGGGFDVRIFTPRSEMPFAGHPTLGTAFIIQQEILRQQVNEVVLNLKVGPIPVTFTYRGGEPDVLWMRQIPPGFGQTITPEQAAQVLGLKPADIDPRFPVQSVSTGVPFFIVPLKTAEALRRSRVDPRKLFALINRTEAKAFLLFCPETLNPENNLQVRVFADALGVPEDPATGSANGCLAGYLVKHRYFGPGEVDIRVEQGHEVGRPSLLLLKAGEEGDAVAVSVGGRVIPVARGELV
jgi:trans-2,3-dihydro-3-hydroxyanthranilate isomerase